MKFTVSCFIFWFVAFSAEAGVDVVSYSGIINPVAAEYISRGIIQAEKDSADCLVIELDTPGGLDKSMRKIAQSILNSKIPVVVYVFPSGSRVASAGAYIALSADLLAMAPGTNIGAGHPVDLNGNPASEKITNDAAAYVKSLAERNNKDIRWAEDMVKNSISSTESEALKLKIADLVAVDLNELVRKLDGKTVASKSGTVLNLKSPALKRIEINSREKLLNVIVDPNIAYVLFLIGIFGLIYEILTPGIGVSGVAGVISLVLALAAFDALSISYAGLALIILAMAMFVADLKLMTHGLLSVGGAASLLIGSLMLFSPLKPYYRLSVSVVITTTLLLLGFFVFVVAKLIQVSKTKVISGPEAVIGETGDVRADLSPVGRVYVKSEEWTAFSSEKDIRKGEKVKVVEIIDGVKLKVERLKSDSQKEA